MSDNANSYPKILIISNNALSNNDNNGKTILSFFKEYPDERLAQLYLRNEEYNCDKIISHMRISEIDIFRAILPFYYRNSNLNIDRSDKIEHLSYSRKNKQLALNRIFTLQITRVIREAIWLTGLWNSNSLRRWLKDVAPERIFFLAGDSLFAYNIVEFIKDEYNLPVTLFITDDYVLSREFYGVFQGLRKIVLRQKLKQAVNNCSNYITISEKMRQAYFQKFKKDSLVSMYKIDSCNIFRSSSSHLPRVGNDGITLVYVGGLQLGRDKVIYNIIDAIDEINRVYDRNVVLNIYSKNLVTNKAIIGKSSWQYRGVLHNEKDVMEELVKADVLLFVETFRKRYKPRIEYSLSTKVPEYLSVGKPIFAVGPKYSGSMQYLTDCAYCCNLNNLAKIKESLIQMLFDGDLKDKLAIKAFQKYKNCHCNNEGDKRVLNAIIGKADAN